MERVRFITVQGKRVLYIDFSGLGAEDAIAESEKAKRLIAQQPPGSLLTLTDISDSAFDSAVTKTAKEYARHNAPYVKAAAVVGAGGLRKALLYVVATFSGRNLAPFDTLDQAKEWLVQF